MHPIAPLLDAPARRALALAVAGVVFAVQFALQSHLVEHDLLPNAHQVCEQCVVAKTPTPSATPPALAHSPARHAAPVAALAAQLDARGPLVVRNRAPPVLA